MTKYKYKAHDYIKNATKHLQYEYIYNKLLKNNFKYNEKSKINKKP